MYSQIFSAVWSVNSQHQSGFKEYGCTSLLEPPRFLFLQNWSENQQRGEPKFASMTHISRQLQVGDIPGSRLLDGENEKVGVRACEQVPEVFLHSQCQMSSGGQY